MLEGGTWTGRGSWLAEGQSRGQVVECEIQVRKDTGGFTVTGQWRAQDGEFAARIAPDDVGTYALSLRTGGDHLQGTAKLESAPNLGLLWNDAGNVHLTFALFAVSAGVGCRGFVRDGSRVYTWEVAFSRRHENARGGNVVALRRRR